MSRTHPAKWREESSIYDKYGSDILFRKEWPNPETIKPASNRSYINPDFRFAPSGQAITSLRHRLHPRLRGSRKLREAGAELYNKHLEISVVRPTEIRSIYLESEILASPCSNKRYTNE